MRGYREDLWLVVLHDTVADDEARRWWNAKESPLLDQLVDVAPRVRLGAVIVLGEGGPQDPDPSGPARRVFDVLFLRGTCPEDFEPDSRSPYVIPLLNAELRGALLAAFAQQPQDHPRMDSTPLHEFRAFLEQHDGARVLPVATAAPIEVDVDT
jgi:hypothetical protein